MSKDTGGPATDRELLELAAKAAGIDLKFEDLIWSDGSTYPCYEDKKSVSNCASTIPVIRWDPLTDDGDALRLAVNLRLFVGVRTGLVEVGIGDGTGNLWVQENYRAEADSATRRAIVRAAAEVGKTMP